MKRIDKLTEKQKAMLPVWADKWIKIGLKTGETDWATFDKYMPICYLKAGIQYPKRVIRVKSPMVGAFAAAIAGAILKQKRGNNGAVRGAVSDAVRGAVGGAVGGAVSGAVSGAVDGAVGGAVRGAVSDAVSDAVRGAVSDAVGGAVYDAVGGAVDGAVDDAVGGAVGGAVGEAVDGAVRGAVGEAVGEAVDGAVGGAVDGAVDGAVRGAVSDAVSDAVYGAVDYAVRGAVGDAVRGAVDDAVSGAVDGAVGDAVDGAVDDAVSDAVGGAVGGAVDYAVRGAVGDAVRGAVDYAVDYAVRGAVDGAVGGAVDGAVGEAVGEAVYGAVDESKKIIAKHKLKIDWHYWLGGQFWVGYGYGWRGIAYCDFMFNACGLKLSDDIMERAEANRMVVESVNYIWPNSDFVMVCARPTNIHINDRGQLHNENGLAIRYPDGWGIYMIDGINVPEHVVMQPETITIQEIQSEKNQEKQRILVRRFGVDRYLAQIGATLVDVDMRGIDGGGARALMREPNGNSWLVATDGSTERVYHMAVDPKSKTCQEAHMSLSGFDERRIRYEG